MLPGLAPTGKFVSVPFIVVVDFEGDKVRVAAPAASAAAGSCSFSPSLQRG